MKVSFDSEFTPVEAGTHPFLEIARRFLQPEHRRLLLLLPRADAALVYGGGSQHAPVQLSIDVAIELESATYSKGEFGSLKKTQRD